MGKLTSKDVRKVWLTWLFNNQACYNYERMMGLGFLDSMCPAIRQLYENDVEGRKAAMERHADFFNCEPNLGSAIVGLSLAMEEQVAEGADIEPDAVRSIKTGLMGPLSGIGDSVIQGVLVPLLLAFAIDMASNGNIAAPIIYCIVIVAAIFGISYSMFMLGYKKGSNAILDMLENGILNKVVAAAGVMGCMVLGALVCNYVTLKCGIQIPQADGSAFSIQEQLFDAILPGLLPLALTLGCYKFLQKGKSSVWVMLFIVIVGAVGGLIGLFTPW